MTVLLCTSLFGCTDEPEYNPSPIPIEEEQPSTDRAVDPDEKVQSVEGSLDIENGTCKPSQNNSSPLAESNSLTMSISLDSKAIGHPVLIDIIESEHGELQYGVVCKGQHPSFNIPKMLGTVRLAVFVDENQNGPSKEDTQGMSDIITITDTDIQIPKIEWMSTPISFYHFDNTDRKHADLVPDIPAGENQ